MNEKEYLRQCCDRNIAKILGFKDRECNNFLPEKASSGLRKEVLDAMNDFCNTAFDVLDAVENSVPNQLYLDQIQEIHQAVVGDGPSG